MEQIRESVPYIVVESTLESALLWVAVLAFLRWSNPPSPRIREVLFLFVLLAPVTLATFFHMLPSVFSPLPLIIAQPVGRLIDLWIPASAPLLWLFLVTGVLAGASFLVFLWRQRKQWLQARSDWQSQQLDPSPLHSRCDGLLQVLAARACVHVPRLVLTDGKNAGSLAFVPCGYIFVPQALAAQLDDEELQALLAHEVAHIVRWDGLLDTLSRGCCSLMLFNPIAYLALARFHRERELATDDRAIKLGCSRLALASCLLRAYRLTRSRAYAGVTELLGCENALEERVQRMISPPEYKEPSRRAWLVVGMFAAAVMVVMGILI